MARDYHRKEWSDFRAQVFEADDFACVRCGKTQNSGAILQVHHHSYTVGKKPWEYPLKDVETLCKGCHAKEHGIIKPSRDWVLVFVDELDERDGECEHCGNSIRYIHEIYHPAWGSLEVGCDCADKLTMDSSTSSFRGRLNRFVSSSRWKRSGEQTLAIKMGKFLASIHELEDGFGIEIDEVIGKKRFRCLLDAKTHLFQVWFFGDLETYFSKKCA